MHISLYLMDSCFVKRVEGGDPALLLIARLGAWFGLLR